METKPYRDAGMKMDHTPEMLDYRLLQEEARCARDYDAARQAMQAIHGQATAEEEDAKAALAPLLPQLRAMLDQDDPVGDAGAWAKAQPLLARLSDARSARRAAYSGALPPAEQALGEPLGTPTKTS